MEHTRKWFDTNKNYYYENKEHACVNCGEREDLHLHHVVPLVYGGTNYLTNVVLLCTSCHSVVHCRKKMSSGEMIKQGIQASDKKQGRKVGQLDKMSDELRSDIKLFIGDRSIKQIDLMNKHNISRNTLKKYIEIIKKEVGQYGIEKCNISLCK